MNSLPKTVTRQRRGCDLNPGPSVPESSTLTTRLPSHTRHLKAEAVRHLSEHGPTAANPAAAGLLLWAQRTEDID